MVGEGAAGDPALERMAGGAGSALGRGGMLTKILAAKRAARSGASTVIASGRERDVLYPFPFIEFEVFFDLRFLLPHSRFIDRKFHTAIAVRHHL